MWIGNTLNLSWSHFFRFIFDLGHVVNCRNVLQLVVYLRGLLAAVIKMSCSLMLSADSIKGKKRQERNAVVVDYSASLEQWRACQNLAVD